MADKALVEETVMAKVRAVATELHPERPLPPDVGLDSLLDHDFALDSLGRLELAGRIEDAFHVTLTEARIANADSPRDLVSAVMTAEISSMAVDEGARLKPPQTPPPGSAKSRGSAVTMPVDARTLTEMLDHHAGESPDRLHIRLYDDECEKGGAGECLSYRQLQDGAKRVAAGLLGLSINPGDAVALMLPTGRDYFFAFFGILYAGGVPVPIYPPARISQISDHIRRHFGILANCRARALITTEETRNVATLLQGGVETIRAVSTVDELSREKAIPPLPVISAGDIAFVQYTSGSTGQPKGVVLTHANLLANVRAMGRVLRVTSDDVFVSWLPLYHDMGLIGAWLGSLYHAVELVIMSPLKFLARPERWLFAIHRFGGTITSSPNFGFEYCVKRISDKKLEGLNLSSLRIVCNGAEPVSPQTIERFIQYFVPYGFNRTAMMPVYGLAECSVGLAFPPLGRGPRVERIERESFSVVGNAMAAPEDDDTALEFVGSGRALPGHEIRVVDAADHELPDRRDGRLQFRGPSATAGYLHNPKQTAELMDGDWLDSGDMAYMADGEVFITGRSKDIIIRAGRNIYPQELEDAVGEIEGVRKGNVAVFASPDPSSGTERLVVLAETRRFDEKSRVRITRAIEELSIDLTAQPPDEVILAPPNTVLKTSSGKIRRAASREVFEKGLVGKRHAAPWIQIFQLSLFMMVPTLRRVFNAATTSAYAAYVWAIAGILGLLSWLVIAVAPTGWRWPMAWGASRLALALCGISFTVKGRERLPDPGAPAIYVANHSSYIDSFVLALAIRRPVSFVAKRELLSHWVPRIMLTRLGTRFIERFDREKGLADAKRLVEDAKSGMALVYFPEATFINRPGILPFQMGAFSAAAEAGIPVVPIAIRGTRAVLVGSSWFPRRGRILVTIGQPIPCDPGVGSAWQQALAVRALARAHILAHVGEPDMSMDRADMLDQEPDPPSE